MILTPKEVNDIFLASETEAGLPISVEDGRKISITMTNLYQVYALACEYVKMSEAGRYHECGWTLEELEQLIKDLRVK